MIVCYQYRYQNGNRSALIFCGVDKQKITDTNVLGLPYYAIAYPQGFYDYLPDSYVDMIKICVWKIKEKKDSTHKK